MIKYTKDQNEMESAIKEFLDNGGVIQVIPPQRIKKGEETYRGQRAAANNDIKASQVK